MWFTVKLVLAGTVLGVNADKNLFAKKVNNEEFDRE